MSAATAPATRPRLPPAVPAAIAGAWVLAASAQTTGQGEALHHDALLHGGLPAWAAAGLFLLAWQAMIAAMMLPSTIPLLRQFTVAASRQSKAGGAIAALLGGYGLVWMAFGYLAFVGDLALHRLVDATPWLAQRPWLAGGAVLVVAGAFQFTSLKERCLRQCRHPGAFLLRFYERGVGGAFRLGRRHGMHCLGCCWALMLVMFAAGAANLWWMAALTALMTVEKTAKRGRRAVPVAGVVLLGWGALVLSHPAWLPAALAGAL